MAITDIYKAVVNATYLGQKVQNRFFYRQLSGPTILAGGLNSALRDDIITIMRNLQTDEVVYDNIEIINLHNPADFGVFTGIAGQTGDISGTPCLSFQAWAFKLNRSDRTMRSGRKSLVGVHEEATEGNVPTATWQAILDAAAPIFSATISSPAGDIYEPLLVRLLPNDVIDRFVQITSAEFTKISTQNSRKI